MITFRCLSRPDEFVICEEPQMSNGTDEDDDSISVCTQVTGDGYNIAVVIL